jgi:predicted enzyme related to lactoylglutathione lyase
MSARFARFFLRTTDVAAARAFYTAVIGDRGDDIVTLPAAAVARGAVPHWLGQIDVAALGGVEAIAARLVARGAARLGPPTGAPVVLRGPGGAIVGLTDDSAASPTGVHWHLLHADDAAQTLATYAEVFGWAPGERVDLGPHGIHHEFAWSPGGASVGAAVDVAGRPGVHTHWLFYFGVPALEPAIAAARAHGGRILGPIVTRDGAAIAIGDDPQGAAFGLIEVATGS